MNGNEGSAGNLKPVRYSLRELLADIEADAEAMGGVGRRLLDQHEIDQFFKHGSGDHIGEGD